ncbi:MAG: hypothetical protein RL701_4570 [Pseudomonadota bacterium]
MHLLVVDDDAELRDLLLRALTRDGHVVIGSPTVESARHTLTECRPDLVVLDLALPDGSGIDLCRELRQARNSIPILMLTAHSEVAIRVDSLDAGADDFLAKPFAVAELRARVRALGRRRALGAAPAAIFERDELKLDLAGRRASRGQQTVELTAREWVVLEALAARPGRVVSRTEVLDQGWGEATEQAAASLEVLIGRIRRKLGADLIRTVRGEGYALESS